MAELVRAHDWGSTPLGPFECWSGAQIGAVNAMLSCRFPTVVLLGRQLVLAYNDTYLPLLADRHPRALGTPAQEVWPEAWEFAGPKWQAVMERGESCYEKNVLVPIVRNGVLRDVYWTFSYSPLYEPDGTSSGVLIVCQDVTQELLAKRERDRVTAQLNQVLEVTTDSVMMLDRQFRYTYANSKALEVVHPICDVIGKNCWELFPGMVYEGSPYLEHYHRAMQDGTPAEFEAFYPEPLNIWVRVQARPSADGLVLFFRDVTEQRKRDDALIKTEKLAAVGRLAASIAHEINNPLESVTNLLFLARGSEKADDVQEYLELAERELRRVSAIANQTLRFHKQASKPRPVSCEDLFGSVLSVYQGRLVNCGISVSERLRCTKEITCFDGEIRQVLSNLVGNSIDSMVPGGTLLLRCSAATGWRDGRRGMVLTVADTGCGIEAETVKRIFEAFFTTKGIAGTGLGLWVSAEIVARHQGALQVRSREGSGTVFRLFLPFQAALRS